MKILCCGDQHITDKKPKNRTDKYFETVLFKFCQEMEIAHEEGCDFVVLPGDVFDSHKESHLVAQKVMSILNEFPDIIVFAVAGQHDQHFHNPDLAGTPLETLVIAGKITLLTDVPITHSRLNTVSFYGASWNKPIPEITTPDNFNVLVLHKMIIDDKLWAEQEGHLWANHILLSNKFDLIVSGDNHKQFTAKRGSKVLVNLGSMMRSTIAQIDHHPAVVVFNTRNKEMDIIDLIHAPFENVMQIEKAIKEKEKNAHLEAFVQSLKASSTLKEGEAIKLDFVNSLHTYMDTNETEGSIRSIIKDCL